MRLVDNDEIAGAKGLRFRIDRLNAVCSSVLTHVQPQRKPWSPNR